MPGTRPRTRRRTKPSEAAVEEYNKLRSLARAAQDKNSRDNYNSQAKDLIFRENNINCAKHEIDLHWLYVSEAISILRERIEAEIKEGSHRIRVIVGRGKNSKDGVPKLKPAVEGFCRKLNLRVLPGENPGVVYISMKQSKKQARNPEVHRTSAQRQQRIPSGKSSRGAPRVPRASNTGSRENTAPRRIAPASRPMPQVHARAPIPPPQTMHPQDWEDRSASVPQQDVHSQEDWSVDGVLQGSKGWNWNTGALQDLEDQIADGLQESGDESADVSQGAEDESEDVSQDLEYLGMDIPQGSEDENVDVSQDLDYWGAIIPEDSEDESVGVPQDLEYLGMDIPQDSEDEGYVPQDLEYWGAIIPQDSEDESVGVPQDSKDESVDVLQDLEYLGMDIPQDLEDESVYVPQEPSLSWIELGIVVGIGIYVARRIAKSFF